MARYTGQKDNSINRNKIYNRDVLYCEEHDEYIYVYFYDGAFRIQFSFDDESAVLTNKIIKANNLIKPKWDMRVEDPVRFQKEYLIDHTSMTDAEYLKSIREELGLTQAEMADKMGYGSQQYISLIENHERQMSGVARRCLHYIAQLEGIPTNSESL